MEARWHEQRHVGDLPDEDRVQIATDRDDLPAS
jgi:hypothetical protein